MEADSGGKRFRGGLLEDFAKSFASFETVRIARGLFGVWKFGLECFKPVIHLHADGNENNELRQFEQSKPSKALKSAPFHLKTVNGLVTIDHFEESQAVTLVETLGVLGSNSWNGSLCEGCLSTSSHGTAN